MSTFIIAEKLWSIRDKITIWNEKDEPVYHIRTKLLSWRKQLLFENPEEERIFTVRKKAWAWRPKYVIESATGENGVLRKKRSFWRSKFELVTETGKTFEIRGNIWENEYEIELNNRTIAEISSKRFTIKHKYKVEIADTIEDPKWILVAAIIIDQMRKEANEVEADTE